MQPSAETADLRRCPACGTALPADAPMGLCVPCLLGSCVNETGGRFGDYELLGLGKEGGMGVVYRARQISLDRIVALKMIRGAFLTTPAQVQRFRAEAAAAARLDHPNIVPIYEIGEHEGRQYFTMKWMEGGSLADALRRASSACHPRPSDGRGAGGEGNRSFSQRRTVELMITIARAVHHAHQRGIIHRDLKPSNILLDSKGEPHVTDFGLAKRLSNSERETGNAELTLSGDTLGTPAYMAPEQAAGNARNVTTAADVYSLGAILYQLLAGQPPFTGGTPLEILRKVVEEEPKPPMRLKSEIRDSQSERNPNSEIGMAGAGGPARASGFGFLSAFRFRLPDLDLICLKCLEKDPADRYHSAEALADDLENWLAHKPISVRPRSAWGRFAKWCCRKPAIAGLSALVLVTALAGFAAVLWKQRQAERARQQAVHNLHKAIEVVTNYLEIVANNPRLRSPGLYPLQKELLQTAVLVLEDFARQHSKDPDVLRRRADAYRTLARMQERHGLRGEAVTSITAARDILESLVAGGKSDGMPLELARVSREAGRLLWLYDRPLESETAYRRALELAEQLTRAGPDTADHRRLWSSTRTEFARFLRDAGRSIEAQALVRAAVDALQSLVATNPASVEGTRELVMALLQHDGELTALSEPTPARAADLTRAVELARNLAGAREPALQDRVNLASALSALGECQHRIGNPAAAEPSLRESAATWDRLKEEWPTDLKMHYGQARAWERLGRLLTATGHDSEAAQAWQKSEDILTRHLGWFPFDVVARFQLIGAYREKARSCLRVGGSDQSRHWLEKALALHDWLMANAPEFSTHQASLAATQHELATVLRELGPPDKARELLEGAVGHYQAAIAKNPKYELWNARLTEAKAELERLRAELSRRPTQK